DLNNDTDAFLACNPFDAFGCAPPTPTPMTPIPTATATATPTSTPPSIPTPTSTPAVKPCVGDCDGDGVVMVNELVRMVNIALELQSVCPDDGGPGCLAGDANCDCHITVDEIIQAVNNALNGCTIFNTCDPVQHAAMCCGS